MKYKIALLFYLCIMPYANGQITEQLHPINVNLERCLAKKENMTTAEMLQCIQTAMNQWDDELNKNYQLLVTELKSDISKEKLRAAQRLWIKFRDSEFEMIETIQDNEVHGSMWLVICANQKLEVIEKRALLLKNYYETIVESR